MLMCTFHFVQYIFIEHVSLKRNHWNINEKAVCDESCFLTLGDINIKARHHQLILNNQHLHIFIPNLKSYI